MLTMTNIAIVVGVLLLLWAGVRLFSSKNEPSATEQSSSTSPSANSTSDAVTAAVIAASIAAKEEEIAVVISAALMMHGLGSSERIVAVRPIVSRSWAQNARVSAVTSRDQMF